MFSQGPLHLTICINAAEVCSTSETTADVIRAPRDIDIMAAGMVEKDNKALIFLSSTAERFKS